jgi:uncharacterized protein (DUF849 family)
MSARRVIVTCAVTGSGEFNRAHPAFPVTPRQIADDAIAAARAGAAIVHLHVRDPDTGAASRDPRLYREVVDRIRDSATPVLINLTGGMGGFFLPDPDDEGRALPGSDVATLEQRLLHLEECRPDIASLDCCTANQASADGSGDHVYLNTARTLRGMAQAYSRLGIKAELEVFGAGDLLFARHLLEAGHLKDRYPMFQCVLGVKWGAPADPDTVLYMQRLCPAGSVFTAMGISRLQFAMAAQSLLVGGHVRVGLEDNLYLERGRFATNAELVERAVQLIGLLGLAPATVAEARGMLALDDVGGPTPSTGAT